MCVGGYELSGSSVVFNLQEASLSLGVPRKLLCAFPSFEDQLAPVPEYPDTKVLCSVLCYGYVRHMSFVFAWNNRYSS